MGKSRKSPPKRLKRKSQRKPKAKSVRHSGIWHPLQTWSTDMDMDPETLKKLLIKSDYHHIKNEDIPFKAIRQACFGEEFVEKIRGMRLANEERERKAAKQLGSLVEAEKVQQVLSQRFVQPALNALDNCPDAAVEWRDKVLLPVLRQKLDLKL